MKDEPAFPVERQFDCPHCKAAGQYKTSGLTKREWFAGLAMKGILMNPDWSTHSIENVSTYATNQADSLIAKLESDDAKAND